MHGLSECGLYDIGRSAVGALSGMMNKGFFIFLPLLFGACSSPYSDDVYLRTVKVSPQCLEATDSLDLEAFDYFQARSVIKADEDWLLVSEVAGDYNLLFLNKSNGEYFRGFRRGRGPGEIVSGTDLHAFGGNARYYDFTMSRCLEICLEESIAARTVVCDTVADFSSGERPVYIASCSGGRFVSGCLTDRDSWYGLYDAEGKVLSKVRAIALDDMPEDNDRRISLMLSSRFVSDPSGNRVCVANVATPSISFAEIQGDELVEVKRIEIQPKGEYVRYTADNVSCFHGLCADRDNVYVLYSGRLMASREIPVNECEHLMVYDWEGGLKYHYILDHTVNSVSVSDGELYCSSTFPKERILVFKP